MVLSDQEEKQIWESWLEKDYGQQLESIKSAVKRLHQQNKHDPDQLINFVPHGTEHAQAVEDLIHKLIPGGIHTRLSQREKF